MCIRDSPTTTVVEKIAFLMRIWSAIAPQTGPISADTTAVSYTHLDVYKRQLTISAKILALLVICHDCVEDMADLVLSMCIVYRCCNLHTCLLYTTDVYKRQLLM